VAYPDQDSRKRIAIFTADDLTWALPTWVETIPKLLQNHDVVGIYRFPDRVGSYQGRRSLLWYAWVFNIFNFLLMSLYALRTQFNLWRSPIRSWNQLAKKYNLQLFDANTPNDRAVINWTKAHNIDVIFIMVGHILKPEIINAPNIGVINKHASLLPGCRGLFPVFWAKLTGMSIGVTFHQVDAGIDTGRPLIQMVSAHSESRDSMLRCYMDTFALYPHLAPLALDKLLRQEYIRLPERTSGYYSLPTRADYQAYRRQGFKIAQFSDLFYQPQRRLKLMMPKPIGHEIAKNYH
jgi:methionyl-tRNA formyltransferase